MTTLSGILGGLFGRRPAQNADNEEQTNELSQGGSNDVKTRTGTTTGGSFEQGPVVVWQAPNKMEAEIIKGRLESEEIPAFIRGEALGSIIGLTSGALALTEVLVPYPLADKAMDLLYDSDTIDTEPADSGSAEMGDSDATS